MPDRTLIEDLRRMWADQAEFNSHFRISPAATFEERTAQTKEMVLHLHSETDELLRAAGAWKVHRRGIPLRENPAHIKIELIDIFKYWLTLVQIHGFSPEEMVEAYWEKSMVVRQRYSEEWMGNLDRPAIVVDIDGVLADYITTFVEWAENRRIISATMASTLRRTRPYIDAASLGMDLDSYIGVRHAFRCSGQHAMLQTMPLAREFTLWAKGCNYAIILLTSRPIDSYPNLHGETLTWLKRWGIPYDCVWWTREKGELVLERDMVKHVAFAVDDEYRYVEQFSSQGIQTYWLREPTQPLQKEMPPNVIRISSLQSIISYPTVRS